MPNLLREDDRAVFGDAGYVNDKYQRAARRADIYWGVALKARPKSAWGPVRSKETASAHRPTAGSNTYSGSSSVSLDTPRFVAKV